MGNLKNRWIKWFPRVTWPLMGKVRMQLAPRCLSESSSAGTNQSGGLASVPHARLSSLVGLCGTGHAGLTLLGRQEEKTFSLCQQGWAALPSTEECKKAHWHQSWSNQIEEDSPVCKHLSPSVWLRLRSFNSLQTQMGDKGGAIYHFRTSTCFWRWSDETLLSCNEICPPQSESPLSPEIYSLRYTLLSISQGL